MIIAYVFGTAFLLLGTSVFIFFLVNGLMCDDWEWAFLIPVAFLIFGSVVCFKAESTEPVVVSTAQSPQIDTTITISNGVVDTVYTYHIIEKK